MPYAGKYDQLIDIKSPVFTKQGNGEKKITDWNNVAVNVPAFRKPNGGNEGVENEQRVASNTLVFVIRYPFSFSINPTMQLFYEGNAYKIISALESDLGRKTELVITCETKDNN